MTTYQKLSTDYLWQTLELRHIRFAWLVVAPSLSEGFNNNASLSLSGLEIICLKNNQFTIELGVWPPAGGGPIWGGCIWPICGGGGCMCGAGGCWGGYPGAGGYGLYMGLGGLQKTTLITHMFSYTKLVQKRLVIFRSVIYLLNHGQGRTQLIFNVLLSSWACYAFCAWKL